VVFDPCPGVFLADEPEREQPVLVVTCDRGHAGPCRAPFAPLILDLEHEDLLHRPLLEMR